MAIEKQGVIRHGLTPSEETLPTPDKVKARKEAGDQRQQQRQEYENRRREFHMGS